MRRKLLVEVLPLALLACVVFASVPSFATAISDTLTVLDKNGNIIAQVVALEGGEGAGTTLFNLPVGYARTSQFGNATVLCESLPCNASSPVSNFSDIVGIDNTGTGPLRFGFTSDAETGTPFGSQGRIFLLEVPGKAYNVTMYLDAFRQKQGDTAWFVSDGDAPPGIPEPGTLILLGSGLLGIAGLARRRKSS